MARDHFEELLAKYKNIQYPSTSQRQFDTLRNDLRREILTPQFEKARMEYQNMLAGTGVNRRSVDATEGGEQQQIIINPTTGATEIVTPEYNRQFRTDATDFNPDGSSIFRNIYDVDEGKIDPRTGKPKDEEVVEDTNTGLISDTGRDAMGRDKDQGASMKYSHEIINGVAYRIDNETGEVETLDGVDAMIAKTLAGYVNNFTIGGILNSEETYGEKLDRIKQISVEAYNEITQNVREQARVNKTFDSEDDNETTFDKLNKFSNKLKEMFGEDTTASDGTNNTGGGLQEGYGSTEADDNRESFRGRTAPDGGDGDGGNDGGGTTQGGGGSGQSGPDAAGAAGTSFCFAPDTLIQMADGSEKEIQNIKLGDNTKGGKVELVVQTLGHNVYNYKDIEVSGSHWVVEDGKYIEVETSKHAKPIDDKEMLYCLNTSDHAIWIKDIQFSDFIGFGLDYSVPGVNKFWESIKDKHTESIN